MPRNHLSRYKTAIMHDDVKDVHNVIYHTTAIVGWNKEHVTLNTGGWNTATTRRKINAAIQEFSLFDGVHVGVFQKKGRLFITCRNKGFAEQDNGSKTYDARQYTVEWDGSPITLNKAGAIISGDY